MGSWLQLDSTNLQKLAETLIRGIRVIPVDREEVEKLSDGMGEQLHNVAAD